MKNLRCPIKLLVFSLILAAGTCLAQNNQDDNFLNASELQWFNMEANSITPDILFKAVWYVAPNRGFYYILELRKDGIASTCRVVPNWAMQAEHSAKLSGEQIEEAKRLLAKIQVKGRKAMFEPKDKERHTAFVFVNKEKYTRADFVGLLPIEMQRVFDFVDAEITAQEAREMKERQKHIPSPNI
ncbi:MAG: hypothetical protein ACR2LC_00850 [Pyrinomonadaceae bacterium]